MTDDDLYGRGWAFPPRLAGGRVAWSAGPDNVREAVRAVLLTDPGERLNRPTFGAGLSRFLFEPNAPATWLRVADAVRTALAEWEPRAAVEDVSVGPDGTDPRACRVAITVRLVATQAAERVTLTLPLTG